MAAAARRSVAPRRRRAPSRSPWRQQRSRSPQRPSRPRPTYRRTPSRAPGQQPARRFGGRPAQIPFGRRLPANPATRGLVSPLTRSILLRALGPIGAASALAALAYQLLRPPGIRHPGSDGDGVDFEAFDKLLPPDWKRQHGGSCPTAGMYPYSGLVEYWTSSRNNAPFEGYCNNCLALQALPVGGYAKVAEQLAGASIRIDNAWYAARTSWDILVTQRSLLIDRAQYIHYISANGPRAWGKDYIEIPWKQGGPQPQNWPEEYAYPPEWLPNWVPEVVPQIKPARWVTPSNAPARQPWPVTLPVRNVPGREVGPERKPRRNPRRNPRPDYLPDINTRPNRDPSRDPNRDRAPVRVQLPSIGVDIIPGRSPRQEPTTHRQSRPKRGRTKEKKLVAANNATVKAIGSVFGAVTEVSDFVDCMYKSMDRKARSRHTPRNKDGSYNTTLQSRMKAVWDGWDDVNAGNAIGCMVANHLQDKAIGQTSSAANKSLRDSGLWSSPVSPQFGPWNGQWYGGSHSANVPRPGPGGPYGHWALF